MNKKPTLIDPKKHTGKELYTFKVPFMNNKEHKIFLIDNTLIFFRSSYRSDGKYLADQIELPLASLDFILATIARFGLPMDQGGLGGLNNSDEVIIDGEKILVMKFIHPHYGIETFNIVNFSRKGYIATPLEQSIEIFKDDMDNGLLAFLVQLNKDYHDGKLN